MSSTDRNTLQKLTVLYNRYSRIGNGATHNGEECVLGHRTLVGLTLDRKLK